MFVCDKHDRAITCVLDIIFKIMISLCLDRLKKDLLKRR